MKLAWGSMRVPLGIGMALAVAGCPGADGAGGTETDSESSSGDIGDDFDNDDFDNADFDNDGNEFPDDGNEFPDDGDDFPDDGVDSTETGAGGTDTDTGGTAGTGATDTGTDTGGGPDDGDCCEVHKEAGCEVKSVQSCVCEEDPFCCNMSWDAICTVLVVTQACGTCSDIGGDGECCMADNGSPGCDDDKVEACVCEMDVACCLMEWDMLCVEQVEAGCGQC